MENKKEFIVNKDSFEAFKNDYLDSDKNSRDTFFNLKDRFLVKKELLIGYGSVAFIGCVYQFDNFDIGGVKNIIYKIKDYDDVHVECLFTLIEGTVT